MDIPFPAENPVRRRKFADDSLVYVLFETLVLWVFLCTYIPEAIVPDRRLQWEEEHVRVK